MNRLTYPTQPEILTVTTPLGNTHHINVWLPVGERTPAVMVEVTVKPRAVNHVPLRKRIAEYMRAREAGLTHWQIADALGENRQTVGRSLHDNQAVFRRGKTPVMVRYVAGRGGEREVPLSLWYLKEGN